MPAPLPKPQSEGDFEEMCRALYAELWRDPTCMRVGRRGQGQGGVDILGIEDGAPVGAQCKFYDRTKFTYATVLKDVNKVDQEGITIRRLYFATTAPADAALALKVHELNVLRSATGLFTIGLHTWDQLSAFIRAHPSVGREYLPDFPGGTLFEIRDNTREAAELLRALATPEVIAQLNVLPRASGTEVDSKIAAGLDVVREALLDGRTSDARAALDRLGPPEMFPDAFSKFRWYTNKATIDLHDGNTEYAIEGYLSAYRLAPENEKAQVNRAHALLLKRDTRGSLQAAEDALLKFPTNCTLWSILILARDALSVPTTLEGIPEDVEASGEVRFAKARIARNHGELESAVAILADMVSEDDPTGQVKRTYLADALEWATRDTALAVHGHIGSKQRSALSAAIALFEPLEACVVRAQSKAISEELVSNISTGLAMLGEDERAQTLVRIGLDLHPTGEVLIRLRLRYLIERGSKEEVFALIQAAGDNASVASLAIAAEFAATRGDVEWCLSLIDAATRRDPSDPNLNDVKLLAHQAMFMSGDAQRAIDDLERYVESTPDHLMARLLLAQILKRSGDEVRAKQCIDALMPYLRVSGVGNADLVNAADLLFALRNFEQAAEVYERVVEHPADDPLTVKFLICLVETGQRKKVRDTLEKMDEASRASGEVRRVEANLAAQSGDWRALRELLQKELAERPGSVDAAIGYATALHHLGLAGELELFLLADPRFDDADAEQEFEFAKLQARGGVPLLGAQRMLRIFADKPTSVKAASFFLMQLMLSEVPASELQLPRVTEASAVHLHGEREPWIVAIGATKEIACWPEAVASGSELAARLLGRQLGETVALERDGQERHYVVAQIQTPLAFAASKANELLAASNSREGPLWSMNIFEADGSPNIDGLLSQAKARREHVERVFNIYRESRLPLAALAKLLGSDALTLYLDWPSSVLPLFVGIESSNGNGEAASGLFRVGTQVVLEPSTVLELTRLELFEKVAQVLPRPTTPSSTRELLREILAVHLMHKPAATLGESDGRLQLTDVPDGAYHARTRLLEKALANLDSYTDVVPVVGPPDAPSELRASSIHLGRPTVDVLMLCLEQESVLVSDDGGLSALAQSLGIRARANVQDVLRSLLHTGKIGSLRYAESLLSKIERGHVFVSISANDLLELAAASRRKPADRVIAALRSLSAPEVDLRSAIVVVAQFLRLAVRRLHAVDVGQIAQEAVRMLTTGREKDAHAVQTVISRILAKEYGRNGRRLKPCERRAFGVLLARG